MLARFPLEIHVWTIPLLFATGWVIGFAHFRARLYKKHRDLYREWFRRTHPDAPPPPEDDEADQHPKGDAS